MISRIHQWILQHDESWLFVGLYVALAVVLSIWISLFWLVAVISVHALFEWIRQSAQFESKPRIAAEALWEIKLDIALILFALALALYMEIILGVLGLQSAARLGAAARTGSRALAWERALRGVLLSLDDAAQVARAFFRQDAKNGDAENGPAPQETAPETSIPKTAPDAPEKNAWARPWGWGDKIAIGLGAICLLLMLLSPALTLHTPGSALATLAAELHPWPGE